MIDETKYEIRKDGNIISKWYNKPLKFNRNKGGYLKTCLVCDDGVKRTLLVHQIIAKKFIPNPDNLPVINHKNEDKTDNRVENLEWCTYEYNNTYHDRHIKAGRNISKAMKGKNNNIYTSKPVYQYLGDELIATYPSTSEAERQTHFKRKGISKACNGHRLTYKGYRWSFEPL